MIITFGSLNADLIFRMEQLPHAGQTLLARSLTIEAGGKGANQAVAAARDGANVVMVGAVGSDVLKDVALENLKGAGVDTSRIMTSQQPTGCASIMTDANGANMIAVALGANADASASQIEDNVLSKASFVLLQMETRVSEIEAMLRRAHQLGVKSILNLAPATKIDADILRLCHLIAVNEDEAEALGGWLGCDASAESLHKFLGVNVIRTLGAEGAEAATSEGHLHIDAMPIAPVDTTAAGDCFVGVLASALDAGSTLQDAMRRASIAAAIACTNAGSQSSIPWKQDTDRILARHG